MREEKYMTCGEPHQRFREARERLHLSVDEAATLCGISAPCVWDIESQADELTMCYSAMDILRFSGALQVRASTFFGEDFVGAPVTSSDLADRIREECRVRKITIEQFEDVVGWKLSEIMQPPQRLLEEMTLDGLQWLCRELHIEWRRVLAAL